MRKLFEIILIQENNKCMVMIGPVIWLLYMEGKDRIIPGKKGTDRLLKGSSSSA